MLKKLRTPTAGFTVIEALVVVLIIAVLAMIIVPGYRKAKKRSEATVVLNEARILDAAKERFAADNDQPGPTPVKAADIKDYLQPGTRLHDSITDKVGPTDIFDRPYLLGTVDQPVRVSPETVEQFRDIIDPKSGFWGPSFAPPVPDAPKTQ
jgi:type II secretory pathway pseudopilin PulG